MARCLVLGASGFIGRNLVIELLSQGHEIVTVGRNAMPATLSVKVDERRLDLFACSDDDLEGLVAGADVVYHLAWSSLPATAETEPLRDLLTNVGLMVRLLKVIKRQGARMVFVSSGGTVYGRTPLGGSTSEISVCQPISAYGACKLTAENYAQYYWRAYGVDIRIARLSNPFGLGQSIIRPQGAVSRFAKQALSGEPIEIWGDGEVVRDYIHVSDAVECLMRLGFADKPSLLGESVFNIGSGHGTTLNEVIALIQNALNSPVIVRYKAGRALDVAYNVLSIERVERCLAWAPSLTLPVGISRLLQDLTEDSGAHRRAL